MERYVVALRLRHLGLASMGYSSGIIYSGLGLTVNPSRTG